MLWSGHVFVSISLLTRYLSLFTLPPRTTNLTFLFFFCALYPNLNSGGLLHIACNVYIQLLVGLRCEAEWGFATTAVVYAVCGVGGNLASAAMSPFTMAVGASGAIVGLVGTRAAQLVAEWDSYPPAERSAQAWQVCVYRALNI